mgnify:CR=1 FL=1
MEGPHTSTSRIPTWWVGGGFAGQATGARTHIYIYMDPHTHKDTRLLKCKHTEAHKAHRHTHTHTHTIRKKWSASVCDKQCTRDIHAPEGERSADTCGEKRQKRNTCLVSTHDETHGQLDGDCALAHSSFATEHEHGVANLAESCLDLLHAGAHTQTQT